MSTVIVVEERLRTKGLALALAIVGGVVAVIETLVMSLSSGSSAPVITVIIVGFVLVLMALLFVGSLRIIVRVLDGSTGRTLEILYGPGPMVCQRFTPEQILGASAQQLSFAQMGGWGYRGSLRLFRYAALSTRRGDALLVNLRGGRRFVVTVDEPDAFAHALNTGRAL
jgi:hypothetical protein